MDWFSDPSNASQTAVMRYATSSSSISDGIRKSPVGIADENVGGISSPNRDLRGSSKLKLQEREAALLKLDALGRLRTLSASRIVDRESEVGKMGREADDEKNTCRCFWTVGVRQYSSSTLSFTDEHSKAPSS